jgi:CHAD domain-containing protein
MKSLDAIAWSLPSKAAFGKLLKVFEPTFGVKYKAGKVQRVEVLDNADWDLWHSGVSLAKFSARDYVLMTGSRELSATIKSPARFWWDFPEGECRALLKKFSPLRALLPTAMIRFAVHRYELLNDDEKVVVRIKLIQHYSAESQQSRKIIGLHLEAIPLIGYEEYYRQAIELIEKAQFTGSALPGLQQMLLAQGITVKPKSPKQFGLTESMPAEQAVRTMGLTLLRLAQEQQQGLLGDIDTEFLHQYRVYLRKLRSLITLLKSCLAPTCQTALKKQLSTIFTPTSRLRDLDVFLLDRHRYEAMLPEEFLEGLNKLFNHISRERQQCQKALTRLLKTKAYQDLVYQDKVKSVAALLSQAPDFDSEESQLPIKDIARQRIVSRYRKVCRRGKGMDDNTSDAEVHQLRIDCKKLRYLLEFFAELFPKKTLKPLLKQLKSLQDILGQFNDYSVQQKFLSTLAAKEKNKAALAAINGLIAILYQQQRQTRSRVRDAVVQFSATKTIEAFAVLSTTNDE